MEKALKLECRGEGRTAGIGRRVARLWRTAATFSLRTIPLEKQGSAGGAESAKEDEVLPARRALDLDLLGVGYEKASTGFRSALIRTAIAAFTIGIVIEALEPKA